MKRKDIDNNIEQIKLWISENRPKNWICKQFNCRPGTLETHLKNHGIDYKGNMGAKGFKFAPNKKNSIEYLGTDKIINSYKLKIKLLSEGIKEEKCEICEKTEWMGKKIPLDLHHKDGNRFNNDLVNLQILCKNCHGLTPNHSKKGPLL